MSDSIHTLTTMVNRLARLTETQQRSILQLTNTCFSYQQRVDKLEKRDRKYRQYFDGIDQGFNNLHQVIADIDKEFVRYAEAMVGIETASYDDMRRTNTRIDAVWSAIAKLKRPDDTASGSDATSPETTPDSILGTTADSILGIDPKSASRMVPRSDKKPRSSKGPRSGSTRKRTGSPSRSRSPSPGPTFAPTTPKDANASVAKSTPLPEPPSFVQVTASTPAQPRSKIARGIRSSASNTVEIPAETGSPLQEGPLPSQEMSPSPSGAPAPHVAPDSSLPPADRQTRAPVSEPTQALDSNTFEIPALTGTQVAEGSLPLQDGSGLSFGPLNEAEMARATALLPGRTATSVSLEIPSFDGSRLIDGSLPSRDGVHTSFGTPVVSRNQRTTRPRADHMPGSNTIEIPAQTGSRLVEVSLPHNTSYASRARGVAGNEASTSTSFKIPTPEESLLVDASLPPQIGSDSSFGVRFTSWLRQKLRLGRGQMPASESTGIPAETRSRIIDASLPLETSSYLSFGTPDASGANMERLLDASLPSQGESYLSFGTPKRLLQLMGSKSNSSEIGSPTRPAQTSSGDQAGQK